MGVFLVKFNPGIDQGVREEYINVIKNQWNYHSVGNFLDEVAGLMVKGRLILAEVDKETLDKLLLTIKKGNFSSVDDWLRQKIREELNAR